MRKILFKDTIMIKKKKHTFVKRFMNKFQSAAQCTISKNMKSAKNKTKQKTNNQTK